MKNFKFLLILAVLILSVIFIFGWIQWLSRDIPQVIEYSESTIQKSKSDDLAEKDVVRLAQAERLEQVEQALRETNVVNLYHFSQEGGPANRNNYHHPGWANLRQNRVSIEKIIEQITYPTIEINDRLIRVEDGMLTTKPYIGMDYSILLNNERPFYSYMEIFLDPETRDFYQGLFYEPVLYL